MAKKAEAEAAAKLAAEKLAAEKAERERKDREEKERKAKEAAEAAKLEALKAAEMKRKQARAWFEAIERKFIARKNRDVLLGIRQITQDFKPILLRKRSVSSLVAASENGEIDPEACFDLILGQLPTLELQKSIS